MSKKRTSDESSNGEGTTEDSDGIFQQIDNAKHGRLTSVIDTTIKDLPIEMLERIFVETVAMEMKGSKMSKSVWKDKADIVISRLSAVCTSWKCILSTDSFLNQLHRALDDTAEPIRFEILHESRIPGFIVRMTVLKDEIFLLLQETAFDFPRCTVSVAFRITVYDRNNMAAAKEVFEMPGRFLKDIAACKVSNCVYVLDGLSRHSILRSKRDDAHQFDMHPWISDLPSSTAFISVSEQGSLMVVSSRPGLASHTAVSIYDPNGALQQQIRLSPDIYGFKDIKSIMQRSNGNLVLVDADDQSQTVLTEINTDGSIVRQLNTSLIRYSGVNFADDSGRIIVIVFWEFGYKLLDSEFNVLVEEPTVNEVELWEVFSNLHFNSDRNEVVGFSRSESSFILGIFRLIEE